MVARRLLGLEDAISLAVAGPTHSERSWKFDLDPDELDPVLGIHELREAYLAADPDYDKGITVPAIVDISTGKVVTNDFQQITLDFETEWIEHHREGAPDLYPAASRDEIDELARNIYDDVNDGVYRCGFAGEQAAYDESYRRLFARLDELSERLTSRRYLLGEAITHVDVYLWVTLVRFDSVYHGHFKCNRSKLTEMPVLWAYARDLFQTPGFGDTIDFDQIKSHYYEVHLGINPTGIVPAGPVLSNWALPHHREELGVRPFGGGTPPGPPPPAERVDPASNPALVRV